MKPSTVLWHLLRLVTRLETQAARITRTVRQHFAPCCNALAPNQYAPAGVRCTRHPAHPGAHLSGPTGPFAERYSWPGHPAGSARR